MANDWFTASFLHGFFNGLYLYDFTEAKIILLQIPES